jgi:predicted phage tail protein
MNTQLSYGLALRSFLAPPGFGRRVLVIIKTAAQRLYELETRVPELQKALHRALVLRRKEQAEAMRLGLEWDELLLAALRRDFGIKMEGGAR